jgi:hypothetical protein
MVIFSLKRMVNCIKKRQSWNTRRVSRSPFRTLARAKQTLKNYKNGKSIGFTATSSLKSMGIIPRASGCYSVGSKYS